jgi:1,4-dihydroxy-2-naphthoate octaprenyltransferase
MAVAAPGAVVGLAAAPLAARPLRTVARRRDPPALVTALVGTARLQLVFSVLLVVGLWL